MSEKESKDKSKKLKQALLEKRKRDQLAMKSIRDRAERFTGRTAERNRGKFKSL